jgi:hypothetical protein
MTTNRHHLVLVLLIQYLVWVMVLVDMEHMLKADELLVSPELSWHNGQWESARALVPIVSCSLTVHASSPTRMARCQPEAMLRCCACWNMKRYVD